MNKRLEKLRRYLPFNLIFPIVLIAIVWLLTGTNHNIFTSQVSLFTFDKCVKLYGLDESTPPRCSTPNSKIYMEFKTKGQTFEECGKTGGKITEEGCITQDNTYVPKPPDEVRTYNECRNGYSRYTYNTEIEPYICIDKNGLVFYAGGANRTVNSFEECKVAGGPIGTNGKPRDCYFDGVIYWQTLKPSHKYLNLPQELKTFEDCAIPGTAEEIRPEGDRISCRAFNNKTYYYDGPKIENFEDCARVMGFVLTSNPPQCYGPDGTHYTGARI